MFFILADIIAYDVEVILIIADFILIWLDYYNFMTLNKLTVLIEIVFQFGVSVISISHIQRLFQDDATWISIFFYILQFIIIYPLFGYFLIDKFKLISQMERNLKDEKMKKTFKGRINLKVRDKVEQKGSEMIKKGLFEFLNPMSSDSEPEDQKM